MMTINAHKRGVRDLARAVYQCSPLKKTLVLINLCFVLLALCAFHGAGLPMVLTSADNGKTVMVSSGSQVIVQLPENSGSTGYTWNFTTSTTSKNQVLTWQNAIYLPPKGHLMFGAPGTIVFKFLAHNSGSTHIQFELRRSWEANVAPAQRFTVTIQVQH